MSRNNKTPLKKDETTQSSILASLHELKEELKHLPRYVDIKTLGLELLTCINQVQDNNPLAARLSAQQVNKYLTHILRSFKADEEVLKCLALCLDCALSASAELEHIATSELLNIRPVEHFLTEGAL